MKNISTLVPCFKNKSLTDEIVRRSLPVVINEISPVSQELIVVSFQDFFGKKFGLRENLEERTIVGDIELAWQKFLKFAHQKLSETNS